MKIGIDASRAFLKQRTGIEEYSYQIIKNLRDKLNDHQVVLYVRKDQQIDFEIPKNWKIKIINCIRLWTQLGLSFELLLHPIDTLFIPAHTVPIIHPKNTIVVVHGLEYEFCPQAYSMFERFYMRLTIKKSCTWASGIISVSQNTKKDLIDLYDVSENKIDVVYEGYEKVESEKLKVKSGNEKPYLLFIGRIEERKNIINIVKSFEILKEKFGISHELILVGRCGHGYDKIQKYILDSKFKIEIKELGFISEKEKWELLKNADVFVFPTLYEGFGIPILEAQSVGCSVLAANNSSIPEITNGSVLLCDHTDAESIAENIYHLISNEKLKNDIILKGLENVKRFSWNGCAEEIAQILIKR